MIKIKLLLNKITIDKYEHFSLAVITTVVLKYILFIFIPKWLSLILTAAIVFACCLGKEYLYDKKLGKGQVELLDILYGGAGIILGLL